MALAINQKDNIDLGFPILIDLPFRSDWSLINAFSNYLPGHWICLRTNQRRKKVLKTQKGQVVKTALAAGNAAN